MSVYYSYIMVYGLQMYNLKNYGGKYILRNIKYVKNTHIILRLSHISFHYQIVQFSCKAVISSNCWLIYETVNKLLWIHLAEKGQY